MKKKNRSKISNIKTYLYLLLGLAAVFYFFQNNFTTKAEPSEANKATETATLAVAKKINSVCLDPGHGDEDLGATNRSFNERDINLAVAKEVKSILESNGYRVVMTRNDTGPNLANSERADICNVQNTDILVSIHHNDYGYDSSVDYSSALYYKNEDKKLANSVLDSVSLKLGLTNNGLESFDDNVLIKSNMPAVLIEGFFVSNYREYSKLSAFNSTRLSDEANSIAMGITNYFNSLN